jgi:hypothetical protein
MATNIYKLSQEPAPEPTLHQNRTGAKTNTVSSFGSSRLELTIGTTVKSGKVITFLEQINFCLKIS